MKSLLLVPITAAWAASYLAVACSGNDEKPASNNGTGAGTTSSSGTGGGASSGSNATGGNGGGGAVTVTSAECMTRHFSDPAISGDCKECMCQCNPAAASTCDENCWKLARCVQVSCADNRTDLTCLTSMCGTFLSSGVAAAQLTQCFTNCGSAECASWFAAGAETGGSGGSSNAGGSSGSGGQSPGAGGTENQGGGP